jgi:hypothetical protein
MSDLWDIGMVQTLRIYRDSGWTMAEIRTAFRTEEDWTISIVYWALKGGAGDLEAMWAVNNAIEAKRRGHTIVNGRPVVRWGQAA